MNLMNNSEVPVSGDMNLLLKGEDGSHATIDWIRQTSLSLVADGEHRIAAPWQRNLE